jgi:hypothetical protein
LVNLHPLSTSLRKDKKRSRHYIISHMDEFIAPLLSSNKKKEIEKDIVKPLHYFPYKQKIDDSAEGISKLYNVLSNKKALSNKLMK